MLLAPDLAPSLAPPSAAHTMGGAGADGLSVQKGPRTRRRRCGPCAGLTSVGPGGHAKPGTVKGRDRTLPTQEKHSSTRALRPARARGSSGTRSPRSASWDGAPAPRP